MRKIKKVYGPYYRKDKRQHVVIIYADGSRRTVSYPKYLIEQHLGRKLDPNKETIDHIDGDFTNNDFSNLRIVSRSQHISEDAVRVELVEITCVWCGKKAKKKAAYLNGNSKQDRAGPFCSKQCSGQYGAALQNGKIKQLPAQPDCPVTERTYYKNKKPWLIPRVR